MYYVGTYTETGNQFSAQVVTNRHSRLGDMGPLFGRDIVHVAISGTTSGDMAQLTGKASEVPNVPFQARLTRLAD